MRVTPPISDQADRPLSMPPVAPVVWIDMSAIARVGAVLTLTMILAGCAPMTPEQRAALEEQDRRNALACERQGRVYVSGSCISRGGGA